MKDTNYNLNDAFGRKLIADEFFGIGRDGAWLDKPDFEGRMKGDQPPVQIHNDKVRVRIIDGFALVEGVAARTEPAGTAALIRYTDSYVLRSDAWWLVASQETPLGAEVDSDVLSQQKPLGLSWDGSDPQGDDEAMLETLNASYVDAFRRADAAWFDAHLSDDYVVTFGDGSFHDRGDALVDFQIPYFENGIRSFPVGAVRIRRFGNFALIHAENDYELKDGRRGINRYTDIWRRTDNGWKCLSAHITVFKPAQ